MNELKEFILDQIESYKEARDEAMERVKHCRENIDYEEDIIEDIEDLNLYQGIIEGLSIVLQELKDMKKK